MDISSFSVASESTDYAKMRQDMFAKTDSDSDGQLSLEEFSAAKPAGPPAGASSESTPAGASSGAAAGAAPTASEVFDTLDVNEDGFVSQSELAAGSAQMPPPPPPPSSESSQSLLSSDTLNQLLQVLQSDDSSTEETDDSLVAMLSENDEAAEDLAVEDDVLELIQDGITAYQNATNAYATSQSAATMTSAQQTYAAV